MWETLPKLVDWRLFESIFTPLHSCLENVRRCLNSKYLETICIAYPSSYLFVTTTMSFLLCRLLVARPVLKWVPLFFSCELLSWCSGQTFNCKSWKFGDDCLRFALRYTTFLFLFFLFDTLCRNCSTWVISRDSLEIKTKKFAYTF